MANDVIPAGYGDLLDDLKERIRTSQVKAALSVNRELVLLYWQIGRSILVKQAEEGWGAGVIDRLSADLRQAFPEMKGFSVRNLKYMRAFAVAWADEPIVQQAAAQLPWFHNCVLLDRLEAILQEALARLALPGPFWCRTCQGIASKEKDAYTTRAVSVAGYRGER